MTPMPAETIARALERALLREPMPAPFTPEREALAEALRGIAYGADELRDDVLRDVGLLTVRALIGHLMGDLLAHRDLAKLKLATLRGDPSPGRADH